MGEKNSIDLDSDPCSIIGSRLLNAPRQLVFSAFTDPKHLKVLEHAGLIARGRAAQWRPCRLEPAALKGVDDWLESYRRLWEERLDRLENYHKTLQAEGKKNGRKK